jgi:hypothetical protein
VAEEVLKRAAMHSWICASRTWSPGGSSVPQTGHSSSSFTSLLGCGGAVDAVVGCGRWVKGGTAGIDAFELLVWRWPWRLEEEGGIVGLLLRTSPPKRRASVYGSEPGMPGRLEVGAEAG